MKKLLALVLVVAMCFGLAACASTKPAETKAQTEAAVESVVESVAEAISEAAQEVATEAGSGSYEGIKIGYCPPTLADAWLALIAEKVEYYCEQEGMEFTATEGNANIDTQIQQTENFIAMGCDIIICQPVNLDAFQTVVKKARDEGVKILFWADDPTWDVEACYLSVDEVQGQLCGEMAKMWADQTFPNAGKGEIKVAWLTTQYDDRPTAKLRQDAMVDYLKDDERFEVVFRKDNLNTTVDCMDAMNECLALNPDINIVFTFSDAHAIGANSAIMADKTLDYSKIAVFGGSATDEGKELVDQSKENKSVIRGLVTFGEGDAYFTDAVEVIKGMVDGLYVNHEVFFCDHGTYNTVGHVSNFDKTEYAAEYAAKKAAK